MEEIYEEDAYELKDKFAVVSSVIDWAERKIYNADFLPDISLPYFIVRDRENNKFGVGYIEEAIPVSVVSRYEDKGEIYSINPPVVLEDVAVILMFNGKFDFIGVKVFGLGSRIWHPHVSSYGELCLGNLSDDERICSLRFNTLKRDDLRYTFDRIYTLLNKVNILSWYSSHLGQHKMSGKMRDFKTFSKGLEDYQKTLKKLGIKTKYEEYGNETGAVVSRG